MENINYIFFGTLAVFLVGLFFISAFFVIRENAKLGILAVLAQIIVWGCIVVICEYSSWGSWIFLQALTVILIFLYFWIDSEEDLFLYLGAILFSPILSVISCFAMSYLFFEIFEYVSILNQRRMKNED